MTPCLFHDFKAFVQFQISNLEYYRHFSAKLSEHFNFSLTSHFSSKLTLSSCDAALYRFLYKYSLPFAGFQASFYHSLIC